MGKPSNSTTSQQELGSPIAIWVVAFTITIIEGAIFLLRFSRGVAFSIADPDDAMRLVQVRELLGGKGWYDQLTLRINPPAGLYIHWSRLVDGAEAGLIWIFQQFISNGSAELVARDVWPLLWILPVTASALFFARNLGGRFSVVICAALLLIDILVFRQFRPGRLDHHNIQITFAMIAIAIASLPNLSWRLASLAGFATACGLAVGLEALPVQAIVGISFAIRLLLFNQKEAAISYGLSLAGFTTVLFLIQTPPSRWLLPFCDALAINLVAGVGILGIGLAGIAASAKGTRGVKGLLLVALALLGMGAYLGIHPTCIAGGFADIDPRLQSIWLDTDIEALPLTKTFFHNPALAVRPIAMIIELLLAATIIWSAHRRSMPAILIALLAIVVVPVAIRYMKSEDYLFWVGLPAFASAAGTAISRFSNSRLVAVLLPIAIAPASLAMAALDLQPRSVDNNRSPVPVADCASAASYQRLAHLKPGLVMADIYLGPQILAYTGHTVLTAPYHRLSTQIVHVYEAQRAVPDQARSAVRQMHVDYIVDCKASRDVDSGFFHDLRQGVEFSWLTRLTRPEDAIQVWHVGDS